MKQYVGHALDRYTVNTSSVFYVKYEGNVVWVNPNSPEDGNPNLKVSKKLKMFVSTDKALYYTNTKQIVNDTLSNSTEN